MFVHSTVSFSRERFECLFVLGGLGIAVSDGNADLFFFLRLAEPLQTQRNVFFVAVSQNGGKFIAADTETVIPDAETFQYTFACDADDSVAFLMPHRIVVLLEIIPVDGIGVYRENEGESVQFHRSQFFASFRRGGQVRKNGVADVIIMESSDDLRTAAILRELQGVLVQGSDIRCVISDDRQFSNKCQE